MRLRRLVPISLAAAAAAMAILVYLNALYNPFVYDDHRTILENLSIRNLGNFRALLLHDVFRPVVNISYALDYSIWGLTPFGFHVTSVLIHAVNVVLLFVLMRTLMADVSARRAMPAAGFVAPDAGAALDGGMSASTAAFAAAAVWAVHPMMTQAVGYASGRPETICALFVLGALLAIRSWTRSGRPAILLAGLACWAVALASKEVAVMLPFVLIAYDRLVLAGPASGSVARRRLARLYWAMLILVAVGGVGRLTIFLAVENPTRARFLWTNAFVIPDVVRQYVSLMFLAGGQSIFHTERAVVTPFDPRVIMNLVWIVALGLLVWRAHRRVPLIAFGAAWFALMLVPSAMMLPLDVGEPMAEQRVYLAGAGFAMAVGAAFWSLREWAPRQRKPLRWLITAAFGALLLALASRTVVRNGVWSDPVRLWQEAVDTAPGVWLPYRGLGDALRDRQDFLGASRAYREAVRLRPQEVETQLALGVSLMMAGLLPEADVALADAARQSPGMAQAETARAIIARLSGRTAEARDRLLAVARAHPDAVLARQQLADMYEREYSNPREALRLCREIQAVAPATAGVADCVTRNQRRASDSERGTNRR
jgi:tetratricopeptide (TPR) repeat protein